MLLSGSLAGLFQFLSVVLTAYISWRGRGSVIQISFSDLLKLLSYLLPELKVPSWRMEYLASLGMPSCLTYLFKVLCSMDVFTFP